LNWPRLALWTATGLAGVLCAAGGWLGYRTYHRLRWYEDQFNLLIVSLSPKSTNVMVIDKLYNVDGLRAQTFNSCRV
jgi:hypothetical protein